MRTRMDEKPETLLKQIVGVACLAVAAMFVVTLWLGADTRVLAAPSRGRLSAAGGIVFAAIALLFFVRWLRRRR